MNVVASREMSPLLSSILLNATAAPAPAQRGRVRATIYDDAAKQALIVLWEASDRICGKRLKPLLRILVRRWCAAGSSHGRTSMHPSYSMNCVPSTPVAFTAANSAPLSVVSDSGVTMPARVV